MDETPQVVSVLAYDQYLSDGQSIYGTHHFCGSCRRSLHDCYHFPKFPEDIEAENEQPFGVWERDDDRALEYFAYCPWCGAQFVDEWWKDDTIQNERVIDHYENPGTHKGDKHEFRGQGPECIEGHWLGVSGGDDVCWCDPEIEPGIMGCVIRHTDKGYKDAMAARQEMQVSYGDYSDDDWDFE